MGWFEDLLSTSKDWLPEDAKPYSSTNPLTNPIVNDIPPYMQYFTQDWMNKSKSAPMKYLEGWQESSRVADYNAPLAFLNNMPEAVQWEDVGPAGARWHGYSTTPSGQWLKNPMGSEAHWQYETEMRNKLDNALKQIFRAQRK